jgi:S-adenosylhomocysteine hydrolase
MISQTFGMVIVASFLACTVTTAGAEAGLEVHVVGDCVEPREALEAVWEGFEVGRSL